MQQSSISPAQTSTELTATTPLLDYVAPSIQSLIIDRGWRDMSGFDQIGALHDFVRNEIKFGYNLTDQSKASRVLADGYGQCNTKSVLMMALLRALGLPCRMPLTTAFLDLEISRFLLCSLAGSFVILERIE